VLDYFVPFVPHANRIISILLGIRAVSWDTFRCRVSAVLKSIHPFVFLNNDGRLSIKLKTQGDIEAAVCDGMSRFEHDFMGRGPKDIRAHLIGDLLVVRLQGVLTAAEQHLVTTLPPEKGRDLLKQVRTQLIEIARPGLEALIHEVTGCVTVSMHHDISTVTGEELVIFSLRSQPECRVTASKVR
jgi:uncharacterized protein YbcI